GAFGARRTNDARRRTMHNAHHCHGGRATMSFQLRENKVMHSLLKQVLLATLFSLSSVGTVLAQNAYITNSGDNTVSVIDTTSNTVTATITVGNSPFGVAVTPDGSTVYVANSMDNTVSVIPTSVNMETGVIPVGTIPQGVAVTPDGSLVYVANSIDNTVSVIPTSVNMETGAITRSHLPLAATAP